MLDEEPKAARVELNAPEVQFSAEGEAAWVAEQLDKVLETLKQLRAVPEAADEAAMGVILG